RQSGLTAGIPGWLPGCIRKPADRPDHGADCADHVREVDGAELVRRLVVVLMQAEAGDGLGDDAGPCERVVVRTLEELLCGVRIGDEVRAVTGEFRPKVRAFVSGEPESVLG